ncbi:thioredoxin domain-containing protein [Saccharopolyspora sp. WRP15-2]|uniref:Thioredoxin domain-containing protein n=1 Tax=Saccharopolyspora oryzae TaxID=2997343 RepID=A0ABT4V699_9PSEU|nr:thioredoxin domain-containing protein [Saccharopolyspora oryzae]MDA3628914.1 thioredoxin domain-containing protein [Saccharopolyspora oryzae]
MSKQKNPLTKKGSGPSTNVILTAIVLVVAVVVIGGVLWFNRDGGSGSSDENAGPPVAAELLRKPDSNLLVDTPDAKVTVVEFFDFQCPACWSYYTKMTKQVEADYAGKITFVARNFPLDMHPLARPAAQAGEAAALQGKFKEMYHAIYDSYEAWAATPDGQVSNDEAKARGLFEQYAQQIGLDMDKFRADVNSPQVKAKIDADVADGEKAGVNSTPTIFINGRQFKPGNDVQSYEQLNQAFRSKLDSELGK